MEGLCFGLDGPQVKVGQVGQQQEGRWVIVVLESRHWGPCSTGPSKECKFGPIKQLLIVDGE